MKNRPRNILALGLLVPAIVSVAPASAHAEENAGEEITAAVEKLSKALGERDLPALKSLLSSKHGADLDAPMLRAMFHEHWGIGLRFSDCSIEPYDPAKPEHGAAPLGLEIGEFPVRPTHVSRLSIGEGRSLLYFWTKEQNRWVLLFREGRKVLPPKEREER